MARPKKNKLADYIACADDGLTMRQASERLGVCIEAVRTMAARHELPFKDRQVKKNPIPTEPLEKMKLFAAAENAAMRKNAGYGYQNEK